MNTEEKIIFDMYENIRLGQNEKCAQCRRQNPNLSKPISIWHVGEEYKTSKYRVLFVGKAARGSIEQDAGCVNGVLDGTGVAQQLYHTVGWPFWSYTRVIANRLYGENDAWKKIAMTNMIKCNTSETVDTTTESTKQNCTAFLGGEIKLLGPKNIVFYTNAWYDDAIASLFDKIENPLYQDIPCGQKQMHIWTFTGTMGRHVMRAIRAGHPERMNKEDFTGQILRFLAGDW